MAAEEFMPTQYNARNLARFLGLFSIGLGLAEAAAPGAVERLVGLSDLKRSLVRVYGLRELAAGIGILSRPRSPGWLWGRVAGDVDLASLGSVVNSEKIDKKKITIAVMAVLGVTALDIYSACRMGK